VRLPTEAQWEYACRAGTSTPFNTGPTLGRRLARYNMDWSYPSNRQGVLVTDSAAVGSFPPNAWGLYDMHGNEWEWCNDYYGPYPAGDAVDPTGPAQIYGPSTRVLRGGSWFDPPPNCRAANRPGSAPDLRCPYFGFRVCLDF
jgi:formylglycine-generating enzyme required for sulfatase activity